MRQTDTHIYFFSNTDYLSNFYPSKFIVNNITYTCNEQYLMAQKAVLFNDLDAFSQIMNTTKPTIMKKFGRKVKNFNDEIWKLNRNRILYEGLIEKFKQNDSLKQSLIQTKSLILVEASPYDRIYGVGLGQNDDRILDETKWLGKNLLGQILMQVRANLV
jgi:ribA/ribD-fused uncharacterized protein